VGRSDFTDRVALVTGGGGGIGAAVAVELARRDATVVVSDAGVSLAGEPLGESTAAATVDRIVAAGGRAVADATSVTDPAAVADLVARTVRDHGGLDVVVEAAGIVRTGTLGEAGDDDWRATFAVHLGGHLAVAAAALPVMRDAGAGRLLHVTSGAGLARVAAESPIYGSAKRAVARLTWGLAAAAPDGVTVNALSPIAATRMVAAPPVPAGGYQLDFGAMPAPDALAPVVATLCGPDAAWLHGRVVFTNGSEVTVVDGPRLVEVLDATPFASTTALDAALACTLVPAHAAQRTTGGAMPRLAGTGAGAGTIRPARIVVAADDPALSPTLRRHGLDVVDAPVRDDDPTRVLEDVDAVVVHTARPAAGPGTGDWQHVLDDHASVTDTVLDHVGWSRAVARRAGRSPVRVVHFVDARSPGGETAAQAVAQLARAEPGPAAAVALAGDADRQVVATLAAVLAAGASGADLDGAELQVDGGWVGLRAHPEARTTLTFGGPEPPVTLLRALRGVVLPSTGG
jgi:NAD(P)-dependent dehydrogenase (short-subunit alcohol dehydrogenase family)